MSAPRARAHEAWAAYSSCQDEVLLTGNINAVFYARMMLAVWFDECEKILEMDSVSLYPRKDAQHEE